MMASRRAFIWFYPRSSCRIPGVAYKTAWYLCHRIREAVKDADTSLLGLESGIVECDEAYIGGQAKFMHASRKKKLSKGRDGYDPKMMVLGAIERGGNVRLEVGQKPATKENIRAFIKTKLAEETRIICTDQHKGYQGLTDDNTVHVTGDHSKDEYVRGLAQNTLNAI